jgi:hypothetical protein
MAADALVSLGVVLAGGDYRSRLALVCCCDKLSRLQVAL